MFEQSILVNAAKAKRIWAASLGVTGQAMLVGAMILAPMLWPETMPRAAFTTLVPHAPPGPRHHDKADGQRHRPTRVVRVSPFRYGIVQPRVIPSRIEILSQPEPPESLVGASGLGIPGGTGDGSALLTDFLQPVAEVERPVETPHPVAKPTPTPVPVQRLRPGGDVRPPVLVHRIDPRYPEVAKLAGISGVVRLTGVIGTDGRIRELAVKSGNPLLVPASLDAVRQWTYQPTLLNGRPVEVETEIVVTFTLNR